MKFYLIIVLVPAICVAANGESSTKNVNSRRVADGGQFPFHISLRTSNINSHICSGAILSQRFILTSASCVRSNAIKYAVLGALGKNDDGQRISVEDIKEHESYDPVSKANNIALVQTAQEIDFSFWIQPIALPPLDWINIGWDDARLYYQMSGWIKTEDRLQYQVANLVECKPPSLFAAVFCARNEALLNGFTQYSANVLSAKSERNGTFLVGILSKPSMMPDEPDTYTRISSFLNWIDDNSKLEDEPNPLRIILMLVFILIVLFTLVLLLVMCFERRSRRRRNAAPTTVPLTTVSSISHEYATTHYNLRHIISGRSERCIPSVTSNASLYPTTPPPPSYEELFSNKP